MRLDPVVAAVALLAVAGCGERRKIERLEWPVMGTVAAVQWRTDSTGALGAVEGKRAAGRVRRVFAEVERLLNRHDPKSEISSFRSLADEEILKRANPLVRPCYEAAFRFRDETGGAFDPRWRGDGSLDLGAIAKGFAVDLAAEAAGAPCLIDLGGNLKAVGGEWKTAVLHSDEKFTLRDGMAAATSAEYYRGRHIFDARSGKAACGGAGVSVIHPESAMTADALSTILFILGRERAEAFLESRYPQACAVWTEHK